MKRLFFYYVTLFATILFVACSDDDSFSTNSSDILTFSKDTVCLDTVFSTVPTSTYTFWVYNNNKEGVRLNQVRLQRGNQSGFRVNVDGTYLDNSMGSSVSGLEIRKGDSIRVFVELTSGLRDSDVPQLVEDNLLFNLESGVEQKVNLRAYSWDAVLCGKIVIDKDSVISSVRPIVIREGLKVDSGVTLTINAPTCLYFHSGAGIDVYGRLVVNSADTDKDVIFRGDRTDRMFDYLPYDRVSGQWRGIRLYSSSTGNIIRHADIHSAEYGIVCDSAAYDSLSLRLDMDCVTIHNCKGPGLKTINSNISMANCQITNNLGDCVGIYGGSALIVYCTFAQFYPFNAERGVALRFTNYYEDKDYPLYILECYNTLVTGYADDEIMGESRNKEIDFGCYFANCILRTPENTENTNSGLFNNIMWEKPDDTIQGSGHFCTIDFDNLYYDFHLSQDSPARGKAQAIGVYPYDRENIERGDTPDIGCYQYRQTD